RAPCRYGRGERGQCWDHDPDGRLDDHEGRAPGLEPDAIVESIGKASIVDNGGSARQVTDEGASIRVDVVMPVARIAMLAVRYGLLVAAALVAGLRVPVRWIEAGDEEGGKQEA